VGVGSHSLGRAWGFVVFQNRSVAGQELAALLAPLAGADPLVLALPRGGVPVGSVPVGSEIARALGVALNIVVVRKLVVPNRAEFAFGAIGEGGVMVVDEETISRMRITADEIDQIRRSEQGAIDRRLARYRGDQLGPNVAGRTVILVDDGVATGATAQAALDVLCARGARRIVLAVPVGSPESVKRLRGLGEEVVVLEQPGDFRAVGNHYTDFGQVSDDEVIEALASTHRQRATVTREESVDSDVIIRVGTADLGGRLQLPSNPIGMVIFVHGSRSSRFSSHNQQIAQHLLQAGIGTLLVDLLPDDEARNRVNVYNVVKLSRRLQAVINWLTLDMLPARFGDLRNFPIGLFGASTGAAAALTAAARMPDEIAAVVSRGGRPDLAGTALPTVKAPTLLLVGGNDFRVVELNQRAQRMLSCSNRLEISPGATHLCEEPTPRIRSPTSPQSGSAAASRRSTSGRPISTRGCRHSIERSQ